MATDEYRAAIAMNATPPRTAAATANETAPAHNSLLPSPPKSIERQTSKGATFVLLSDQRSMNSIRTHSSSDSEDDDNIKADFPEDWMAENREQRETWTSQLDFILSCIGYAVGLGNVWRFPYLCYSNGGGAFLVPYFTFLLLCGMPLTMLEMSLGQFASLGPTALFQKFCPLFQGLGWSQVLISGICCVYYNIIIAWTLYYLLLSFSFELPWSSCNTTTLAEFADENCVDGLHALPSGNLTNNTDHTKLKTASEMFWNNYVLRLTDGIDNMGGIRPELLISLVVAWVMIYACLFKGVKSSGKVVKVTATFPYVVLAILMVRGITLPGAMEGIKFYLMPDFWRLTERKVWIAAASQIFYSVGASWGVMITFASFNRFNHNCYRDAIVIPLINCGTSVFAGIVVFSIIGFMAHNAGKEVEDVIKSGPGLAFIVYPEAVANLPISPVWSILFFLMLLTIGVDSQFGMFETFITAIVDTYPATLRKHKPAFTGCLCFVFLLLGIPCIMQGGMYVLQLMDWYSATFALMLVALIETLIVAYNYGWRRYLADMRLMVRRRPSIWWPICWMFISPTVVISLLVASIVYHVPVSYDEYVYPGWAEGVGWVLAMAAILPIPGYMCYSLSRAKADTWKEKLAECMRPTPDWGPSRLGDRVRFRKSMNKIPGKQLYVKGVERQETEMKELVMTHPSAADLVGFIKLDTTNETLVKHADA